MAQAVNLPIVRKGHPANRTPHSLPIFAVNSQMTLVQQLADGAAALEPAANAANGWRTLGQICLALDEERFDGGTPAIRIWATSGPMACLKGPQVPGRLEKGNTALLLRADAKITTQ